MARPKEFDPDAAIEQAMKVFWRQGYGATTPQGLADTLRIGKGSLYNAFGGKRQLFDLALRRYLDLQVAAVTAWLESSGPAKERLRNALHFLVESDLADPDRRGCLATNSAVEFGRADEAVAAQVRGLFDRTESTFQGLIEEGQCTGEIDPGRDAKALASMLLNTITGMHVLARIEPGPGRLLRVVDATIDLL
ncbi:TetR/AcrR family transcriptional regulator [Streptomyces sp. 061-3]|uniref:TetR/AcrR family transcriptional regulator n=1 Tax=Streptomyces sp. 061-3 TaxID=2789268 RepID=UPI00397F734C